MVDIHTTSAPPVICYGEIQHFLGILCESCSRSFALLQPSTYCLGTTQRCPCQVRDVGRRLVASVLRQTRPALCLTAHFAKRAGVLEEYKNSHIAQRIVKSSLESRLLALLLCLPTICQYCHGPHRRPVQPCHASRHGVRTSERNLHCSRLTTLLPASTHSRNSSALMTL